MDALFDIFGHIAGAPAIAGLILTALTIYLTSDWRLSLTALLVQYVLIGLALTRSLQVEVSLVKILAGSLAVFILYLTARRIQERQGSQVTEQSGPRLLGMQVGWGAGPLGLPLRLLTAILIFLAALRVFSSYNFVLVPADIAFVTFWLGTLGILGLVISENPLRVAPAILTILGGFDLIYATWEPSLAVVGFWSTLILLAALAFAYLATAKDLGAPPTQSKSDLMAPSPVEPTSNIKDLPETAQVAVEESAS